jgi:hypothetical protein
MLETRVRFFSTNKLPLLPNELNNTVRESDVATHLFEEISPTVLWCMLREGIKEFYVFIHRVQEEIIQKYRTLIIKKR